MGDVARIEETTRGGVKGRTVLMSVVPNGSGWTERSRIVIISHLDVVRAERWLL